MRKMAAAIVASLMLGAAPAAAMQAGAPVAEPATPGHWDADGWRAGGAPAAMRMPRPASRAEDPYQAVHPGQKLKGWWRDPSLEVEDWAAWGLGRPGPGMRWIRHYDDAVLLDADDRVVTAYGGMDWDRPRPRALRRAAPPRRGYGPTPAQAAVTVSRPAPGTVVTTQQVWPQEAALAGYAPGSIVGLQPGTIVTTTTIDYIRPPRTVTRPARASRGRSRARR